MFKTTGLLIIGAVAILQGCSGLSVKQQKLPNVTSSPSGATVYANLLELGKTPLKYNLYDVFHAGWDNSIYQAQGVLIVKKKGCDDFTLKINDHILRNLIHAELKCSGNIDATESIPVFAPATTPAVTSPGGTEKRLEELEAIFKKGVITKDEYKTTRERILNEL